ncbi:ribonuclease H [Caenorhabditis elegans]|uniref:ribonuclease H n=1 Tax=Caenorhabditis elegans TaxID=6239 RepID=Q23676_CAEEL|nr:RNase H type-1 domain-containing protein [Caenorhabditis elegans]CAA90146.2 RNase H type-1 domain-containing protein [Caenorhabditis elegans]|eukprot:NP_496121.2 RNase H [Caenorhabditis elegans]
MTRRYREVYTDGSTVNNGKRGARGGWAIVFPFDRSLDEYDFMKVGKQTNNVYELTAIYEATEVVRCWDSFKCNQKLEFVRLKNTITPTTSSILIPCTRRTVSPNGSTDGTNMGGLRITPGILSKISRSFVPSTAISESLDVKIEYVKGHHTNFFNCEADRLAKKACRSNINQYNRYLKNKSNMYASFESLSI